MMASSSGLAPLADPDAPLRGKKDCPGRSCTARHLRPHPRCSRVAVPHPFPRSPDDSRRGLALKPYDPAR
jgi:hypothetical protein